MNHKESTTLTEQHYEFRIFNKDGEKVPNNVCNYSMGTDEHDVEWTSQIRMDKWHAYTSLESMNDMVDKILAGPQGDKVEIKAREVVRVMTSTTIVLREDVL